MFTQNQIKINIIIIIKDLIPENMNLVKLEKV